MMPTHNERLEVLLRHRDTFEDPLAKLNPWIVAIALILLSLAVAPFVVFKFDFEGYWVPWTLSTNGRAPWAVYSANSDYPPFLAYLWTLAELVRQLVHGTPNGTAMLLGMKVPNILAHAMGGIVIWKGFSRLLGERKSRLAGVLYLISPAIFVNSALWGQCDAILTLMLLLVFVAILSDRVGWAGFWMGLAVTTKFQAVVIGPVLLIYVIRKYRLRGVLISGAFAGVAVALAALPMILGGAASQMWHVYTHVVGRWPHQTEGAFNFWYLLDGFEEMVLHIPREIARSDAQRVLGLLTLKQIGLGSFMLYAAFVCYCVWRKPTPLIFIFSQVMLGFGFLMLPTEMHERYAVPAAGFAAILAVMAPSPGRLLYVGLTIFSALNESIILYRMCYMGTPGGLLDRGTLVLAALISLGNIALLIAGTWQLWHIVHSSVAQASLASHATHDVLKDDYDQDETSFLSMQ